MPTPDARTTMRLQRGMTLVELIIVLVVVAILGTIAVATYRRQVLRAHRVDATATLLQVQVAQEKFILQNRRYADGAELTAAPPAGLGLSAATPAGHYALLLASPTANTYTVTAMAQRGQSEDTTCLVFTVNEQGMRTPGDASGCWR